MRVEAVEFANARFIAELCDIYEHHGRSMMDLVGALEQNPDPLAHGGEKIENPDYDHVYEFTLDGADGHPPVPFVVSFPARVDAFGTKWLHIVFPYDHDEWNVYLSAR